MDETPLAGPEHPNNVGKPSVKRDKRGRVMKGAAVLNPTGRTGTKTLTAQQFIEHLYEIKGDQAISEIWNEAFRLTRKGNTTLLCKILDKILPSKVESKTDMEITHREEFLRMRARAMEILRNARGNLN